MEKKELSILDDASLILSQLSKGVLLTTKDQDKVNTMTIGWGTIGIEWGQPIFTAFVRTHRHSKEMLDHSGSFTINAPYQKDTKQILGYCGSHSGRDVDKIKELGLHLVPCETIDSMAIQELPLTLECEILYSQVQDLETIPEDLKERYYPQNVDSLATGSNKDVHVQYIAKIKKAYILK